MSDSKSSAKPSASSSSAAAASASSATATGATISFSDDSLRIDNSVPTTSQPNRKRKAKRPLKKSIVESDDEEDDDDADAALMEDVENALLNGEEDDDDDDDDDDQAADDYSVGYGDDDDFVAMEAEEDDDDDDDDDDEDEDEDDDEADSFVVASEDEEDDGSSHAALRAAEQNADTDKFVKKLAKNDKAKKKSAKKQAKVSDEKDANAFIQESDCKDIKKTVSDVARKSWKKHAAANKADPLAAMLQLAEKDAELAPCKKQLCEIIKQLQDRIGNNAYPLPFERAWLYDAFLEIFEQGDISKHLRVEYYTFLCFFQAMNRDECMFKRNVLTTIISPFQEILCKEECVEIPGELKRRSGSSARSSSKRKSKSKKLPLVDVEAQESDVEDEFPVIKRARRGEMRPPSTSPPPSPSRSGNYSPPPKTKSKSKSKGKQTKIDFKEKAPAAAPPPPKVVPQPQANGTAPSLLKTSAQKLAHALQQRTAAADAKKKQLGDLTRQRFAARDVQAYSLVLGAIIECSDAEFEALVDLRAASEAHNKAPPATQELDLFDF